MNPFKIVWCRNNDADEAGGVRPMRRWRLWWLGRFGNSFERCWYEDRKD